MKVTRDGNHSESELITILDKNDRRMLDTFMKSFFLAVKDKYSIEGMQLKVTLEGRDPEKNFLPGSIFTKKLGILETIVKYLHENLGLANKDISTVLKRSPANIAVTYANASRKMPEGFQVLDFGVKIPLNIFSESLTCFESICLYLKRSFTLHQIGAIMKRDDRTIWTVHNRASRKVMGK
jgi:hypothetical protein